MGQIESRLVERGTLGMVNGESSESPWLSRCGRERNGGEYSLLRWECRPMGAAQDHDVVRRGRGQCCRSIGRKKFRMADSLRDAPIRESNL